MTSTSPKPLRKILQDSPQASPTDTDNETDNNTKNDDILLQSTNTRKPSQENSPNEPSPRRKSGSNKQSPTKENSNKDEFDHENVSDDGASNENDNVSNSLSQNERSNENERTSPLDISRTSITPVESKKDEPTVPDEPKSRSLQQIQPVPYSDAVLIPKRYILLFMLFLGFAVIYSLRVNINVAIVAMVNNKTKIENGKVVVYVRILQLFYTQAFSLAF